MRTLLAAALALSLGAAAGCGSSCVDDVCYAPPARAIPTSYCGPVQPLAPLPSVPSAPIIGRAAPVSTVLPPPAPVGSITVPTQTSRTAAPSYCPPNQPCI